VASRGVSRADGVVPGSVHPMPSTVLLHGSGKQRVFTTGANRASQLIDRVLGGLSATRQ
jgi:hypothetical protein